MLFKSSPSDKAEIEVRFLPEAYPSYEHVPTLCVDLSGYHIKNAEIWNQEPRYIRHVQRELFRDLVNIIEENLREYNYKIDLLADENNELRDGIIRQAESMDALNKTLASINEVLKEIGKDIKEADSNCEVSENSERINCGVKTNMLRKDIKSQVISALENPEYHWRTVSGIVGETSLNEEQVKEILNELILEGCVVKANRHNGQSVFTTRSYYSTSRNWLIRLFSSLSNRIL